jgi:hypothetical protein
MNGFTRKGMANDNIVSRQNLALSAGLPVASEAPSQTPPPFPHERIAVIEEPVDQGSIWTTSRLTALVFFIVSTVLALFSLRIGLPARTTGLLCALSALAAAAVLYGLPHWQTIARGVLALAVGAFSCLSILILLPALNLWPSGGGPLLFSMIFAIVGTLTKSRACLSLAIIALFGLMIDSDGLTRMRLDAQVATLGLFAIGLCGSVMAGSRIIAGVSVVAVMGATMTLMASFGIPTPGALAILSVFAIAVTLALRAYVYRGYSAAEIPMILSGVIFALAAIGFQLFLMGDFAGQAGRFATPMPNLGVMILIGIQGMVLFVSLVGWFARRLSLADVMLTQAIFGLICTVIADPMRLERIGVGDPSLLLAGLVGVIVAGLAGLMLYKSWLADRPVLTSLSAMTLMIQIIFGMRLATGNFDVALAALVCAGLAMALAVVMMLNPRNIRQSSV